MKPSGHRLGLAIALIVLAVLETAWMGWYLAIPLPNAGNVGGVIRRWIFPARAFPQVIPGVRFDESYLGLIVDKLGHPENLVQRAPVVLAAALIAAGAIAFGRLVLRLIRLHSFLTPFERFPLAFGLGMTGLGSVTLVLGRLGWIGPWPVRVGLAILVATEVVSSLRRRGWEGDEPARVIAKPAPVRRLLPWAGFAAIAGPFLLTMFLGAMLPTIDFDAIEYHLEGPKEYFLAGKISFLPHNVYTSMPFNIEMLHLLGMEVLGDWWSGALAGQLLVALHAPAAAAMIALTALRLGSPRAAWVAPVVYLTTPWIYRIATIPYVEGPLCYYHAALIWITARILSESPRGSSDSNVEHATGVPSPVALWAAAGILTGGAMGCKYPGLISAVVPFGVAALVDAFRRRSARIIFAFGLGWAAVMSPWLIKNVIDTGNPVYPLAYRIFGGRQWDSALDAKWSSVHGPRPINGALLLDSMLDVVGRSDWQSPLYVALAPLALLRREWRRRALVLWGYVLYIFATWWLLTHRLDRFWLPILPPLAVLAGLGADWVRSRAWTTMLSVLMGLAILTSFTYCSTGLAGLNEWTSDYKSLRRSVPEMLNPPLVQLDRQLPQDAKVLLVGQAAVFNVQHPVVYNTVFNRETIERLTRDRSPDEIRGELQRLGITHVYVDWFEIERYRSPGNYGFTDYVTPELFARLVSARILRRPVAIGPQQELFEVEGRPRAQVR